jgi:hypothetical protein
MGNPAGSNRWGLPFLELDSLIRDQESPVSLVYPWEPMSSDRSAKRAHRDGVAGVPSVAICEARAAQALQAAEDTNLSNVREIYARSALRWSELADQKTTRS